RHDKVTVQEIAARRNPHCLFRSQHLSSTFYLLPSTFCLLPSAFCLLPSTFCLLPSALATSPSETSRPVPATRWPPSVRAARAPSSRRNGSRSRTAVKEPRRSNGSHARSPAGR